MIDECKMVQGIICSGINGPGIYGPCESTGPNRSILDFSKFSGPDLLDEDGTEPLDPGPIGFGP